MNSFFRFISVIFKTILAILISSVICIKYMEKDPWITSLIKENIRYAILMSFKDKDIKEIQCYCDINRLDIFNRKLHINRFDVNFGNECYLKTKKIDIHFFILNFFINNFFKLDVICHKVKAYSKYQNKELDLARYFNIFMSQPSELPILANNIYFKFIDLNIDDINRNKLNLKLKMNLSIYDSCLKTVFDCTTGSINILDKNLIKNINGSGRAIIPFNNKDNLSYKIYLNSRIFNADFNVNCSYYNQSGSIRIDDYNKKFYGDLQFNQYNLNGDFIVSENKFFISSIYNKDYVNLNIRSEEEKLFHLDLEYINRLNSLNTKFKFNNKKIHAKVNSHINIESKKISLKYLLNIKHLNNCNIIGKLNSNFESLYLNGKINQNNYSASFDLNNQILKSLILKDKTKHYIKSKNNVVVIDLLLLQKIANLFDLNLQGNGRLVLGLDFNNKLAKLIIKDGFIKIGAGINFIKDVTCSIKFNYLENLEISINNLNINFYEGSLKSNNINMILDPYYQEILWISTSLNFDKIFINIKNMLLGILMGNLSFIYDKNNPKVNLLNGQVYLAKSKFKANILSDTLKFNESETKFNIDDYLDKNINLCIDFITKNPIDIETELIKAEALINIKIRDTAKNISLSGGAEIITGTINFPYKPLYIKNGLFSITDNNINNISINLSARNDIKDFTIISTFMGTINNPEIKFTSHPSLTDEQILALLLSGSENTPLMFIMPNLFMQNLDNLVVGIDLLKNILKPLKHIRVSLDKVEVDFTDKFSAKIKNGMESSHEMQYELEYGFSDDIKMKAIKDYWGGIGPEIEVRWKF